MEGAFEMGMGWRFVVSGLAVLVFLIIILMKRRINRSEHHAHSMGVQLKSNIENQKRQRPKRKAVQEFEKALPDNAAIQMVVDPNEKHVIAMGINMDDIVLPDDCEKCDEFASCLQKYKEHIVEARGTSMCNAMFQCVTGTSIENLRKKRKKGPRELVDEMFEELFKDDEEMEVPPFVVKLKERLDNIKEAARNFNNADPEVRDGVLAVLKRLQHFSVEELQDNSRVEEVMRELKSTDAVYKMVMSILDGMHKIKKDLKDVPESDGRGLKHPDEGKEKENVDGLDQNRGGCPRCNENA